MLYKSSFVFLSYLGRFFQRGAWYFDFQFYLSGGVSLTVAFLTLHATVRFIVGQQLID